MPVQLVLRPTHEFRGYAGQILSGSIQPGDVVLAANGVRVATVDELRSAVEKSRGHVALLISAYRKAMS